MLTCAIATYPDAALACQAAPHITPTGSQLHVCRWLRSPRQRTALPAHVNRQDASPGLAQASQAQQRHTYASGLPAGQLLGIWLQPTLLVCLAACPPACLFGAAKLTGGGWAAALPCTFTQLQSLPAACPISQHCCLLPAACQTRRPMPCPTMLPVLLASLAG